jgi:hypothetical protein
MHGPSNFFDIGNLERRRKAFTSFSASLIQIGDAVATIDNEEDASCFMDMSCLS